MRLEDEIGLLEKVRKFVNKKIFVYSLVGGLVFGAFFGCGKERKLERSCVSSVEICDGEDNDCDGQVDEDLEKFVECGLNNRGEQKQYCESGDWINRGDCIDRDICKDNNTKDCYTGPAETREVGACKKGIQHCIEGVWRNCEYEVLPSQEICGNGIDDDCDGEELICGTKKWEFLISGSVWSSPAIAEDRSIYIGSGDGKLYAINHDGTKKWEFLTEGEVGSPAIDSNGIIYIGSGDDKVYAINPDGTKKWEFLTEGSMFSPAIGSDGTIYIGSNDKKLYAINRNGRKKWEFLTGNRIWSAPSIGSDGTIYIDSTDGKIYALNPNGRKKWEFRFNKDLHEPSWEECPYVGFYQNSLVIGCDNTIYYLTYGCTRDPFMEWETYGRVLALDFRGVLKWEFNKSIIKPYPVIDSFCRICFFDGRDDYIAVDLDGKEERYPIEKGGLGLWPTGYSSLSVGKDGLVYFQGVKCGGDVWCEPEHKSLFAMDVNKGSIEWFYSSERRDGHRYYFSSPAIDSQGIIYTTLSSKNTLYAIFTSSLGLADSPWPKFRHDNMNTGNVKADWVNP